MEILFAFRYFCKQGAITGTPNQGPDADECPAGHYCPIQTAEPIKCPQGTYSNATKLKAESECSNCTAGNKVQVFVKIRLYRNNLKHVSSFNQLTV